MRTTRVIGLTAALLGALATAGCSSGSASKAGTSQSATATQSASSTISARPTTSSASATPTSSGTAAGAPGVPEPARQHTKAGAIAFARHYVDVVNETAVHPEVGRLEPLALKSCKTCDNHESTVSNLVAKNQHFSGPEVIITRASIIGLADGMTLVEVRGREPEVSIVDSDGTSVKTFPEVKDQGVVLEVKWTTGWRVATLKTTE